MSRIFVTGWGAVSPAGWTVAALRDAVHQNIAPPVSALPRPGWETPLSARSVPPPAVRPEFLSHPRLRRASPITHYAASAALQAIAPLRANPAARNARLGVIACLQSGCVQYSCRFYDETLKNPATASPLVFPETVYAAPTSHVSALLENVALACSIVGDPAAFLQGVALAANWLAEDRIDACLVIGAEELNWIIADALQMLDRSAILSAGAGALCLRREAGSAAAVELEAITDPQTFSTHIDRHLAAQRMRQQLAPAAAAPNELLVDGTRASRRADAAELAAWRDWSGPRLSPKQMLGEGMMAAAAWQCVLACDAIASRNVTAANVSLVGSNQQAIGARFAAAPTGSR
jgi:3-oxoacyl-(acyl-carrier-protein) synthase